MDRNDEGPAPKDGPGNSREPDSTGQRRRLPALNLRRRQIEAETKAYNAAGEALDAIGDRIRLARGDYDDLKVAIVTEHCAMVAALDDLIDRKIAGGFEPIQRGGS